MMSYSDKKTDSPMLILKSNFNEIKNNFVFPELNKCYENLAYLKFHLVLSVKSEFSTSDVRFTKKNHVMWVFSGGGVHFTWSSVIGTT